MVCGLRNKDIQKKLLTAEHNLDEALKKALGAEAAEEDVAAFSQKDAGHATPVNKLDSDGRPPYRPRRPCRPSFSLSVFSINAENKGIEIPVELNGIHLLMELDTGAGVSIISQEFYNRHFMETPLQPCDTRLRTYTEHPVQVSGQFLVQLKYQNQTVTVPLLVVKGPGPSLFGKNWLSRVKLDWKKICSIRVSVTQASHQMSSHNCTT